MYSTGPPKPTPALLTRPASPCSPTASRTFCSAASIELASVTSIVTGVSLSDPSSSSALASFCLRTPAKTV